MALAGTLNVLNLSRLGHSLNTSMVRGYLFAEAHLIFCYVDVPCESREKPVLGLDEPVYPSCAADL